MNNSVTHVVTGQARLSYCNLVEPRANKPGDEPKYSVTVLVPKSDVLTKQKLDAAIAEAIEQGVNKKWNGVRPPMIPTPVHDGDGTRPSDGMPFGPECRGCWVFTASAKQAYPPNIVDRGMNAIMDKTEIYSGMYGRVAVDFYPYFAANKRGIGCGLVNVQKLADGEPLGSSRSRAEDDFGDDMFPVDTATAPAYPPQQQPAYPAYPVQSQQPGYAAQPAYPAQPGAPAYSSQQPSQGARFDPVTGQMV